MTQVYRIVQYMQPWEIDDFERQVHGILPTTYHLPAGVELVWDVTMNLDIVDWTKSRLPRQYYLDRFNYLEKVANRNLVAEFDTNPDIKGCTDKRRVCTKKPQDYIIWLDSDVFSTSNTLPGLINATRYITEDTYILTPEIVKFWDGSWDQITSERFLKEPYTFRDTFNVYSLDSSVNTADLTIRRNVSGIKFAGGWFNLFTNSIFKGIEVPDEIGAYGPDDTYTMMCAQCLGIPQYILGGVLVTDVPYPEHYYARAEYKKKYLEPIIGDRDRISDQELYKLIQRFYDEHKPNNTELQ